MLSSFPAELSDAIIDYLYDDRDSLATCALVCKRWLPSSRYHLFGSVVVNPQDVEDFIKLLHSPFSTIALYISRLGMIQISSGEQLVSTMYSLRSLRSVNSLYLKNVTLVSTASVNITQSFRAVAELELKNVLFCNFQQFVDFMSHFSLLEKFVVKHLLWKTESPSSVQWTTPSTLRVIDLDLCPVGGILKWICTPSPVPPVHTVRFRGLTTPWLLGVQYFLRALGPSLQHLSLKYHFSHNELMTGTELCRHLDLSHNHALRTIDLDMTLHQLFLPISPLVQGAPLLLSQITSPVMEEVILRLHLYSFEDINSLDWGYLEHVFTQPQFSCLRRVHCQLGYTPFENVAEGWRNIIKTKLTACHKRGILRVSVTSLPEELQEIFDCSQTFK